MHRGSFCKKHYFKFSFLFTRLSIVQFCQESGASTKKEKQAAVTSDKSHSDSDATCQCMSESVRKSVAPHGTALAHSLQVDHEDSAVASFMERLVMVCDYPRIMAHGCTWHA